MEPQTRSASRHAFGSRKDGRWAAILGEPLRVEVRGRFLGLREVLLYGPTWAVLTVLTILGLGALIYLLLATLTVAGVLAR